MSTPLRVANKPNKNTEIFVPVQLSAQIFRRLRRANKGASTGKIRGSPFDI